MALLPTRRSLGLGGFDYCKFMAFNIKNYKANP